MSNDEISQDSCAHRGKFVERIKVQCGRGRRRYKPAYKCALFKLCLPTFKGPWDKPQRGVEDQMFHLCHDCKMREPGLSINKE